jgi:uncharacterized membrane protein
MIPFAIVGKFLKDFAAFVAGSFVGMVVGLLLVWIIINNFKRR